MIEGKAIFFRWTSWTSTRRSHAAPRFNGGLCVDTWDGHARNEDSTEVYRELDAKVRVQRLLRQAVTSRATTTRETGSWVAACWTKKG